MLKTKWTVPVLHVIAWILYFSIPFMFNSYINKPFEKNKYQQQGGRDMMRDAPHDNNTDHAMPPPPGSSMEQQGNHPENRPPGDFNRQMPGGYGPGNNRNRDRIPFPYLHVFSNILLVPIFYLNIFFFLPRWFGRKKYWIFAGVQVALCVVVYYLIKAILFSYHPMPPNMMIFNFLFILLAAFCYYLVKENVEAEKAQKEKENATLTSELQFLRWQISPHFLFNVLNNMVALARIKSDKLEPMLIGLSTLMRYMTYETDERKVTIEKEIEYLNSYIALQSLRYGSDVTLNINMDVNNASDYRIEPMLLIPFVENAFKHGTGIIEQPFIDVLLSIKDNVFFFEVKNKFLEQKEDTKDNTHGIGLANVRRRLNLLYENRYNLDIFVKEGVYTTSLTINL